MLRRYSISPEQARINIAAAEECIAYAQANGLHVRAHWFEVIERAEEVLRSASASSNGRPERSRSFEPSARVASRKPKWRLRSSEPTARKHVPSANEAPELLDVGSGFKVELNATVCKAIEQEVLGAIWEFDSQVVETGGWLYGLYSAENDRVAVVHASGPGQNGSHGAGWTRLSNPDQVEADFSNSLARARLVRVGDWHSHPNDDPIPSDADLRIWGRHSDDAGVLPYASVIVTPGEVGWMTPEFHGWVTREDDRGLLVCEPSRIDERFG
jgi:proteasome lid subunit RPN8/RPN11